MILKISLRAKGGVPKTILEQKHRLNFLYFPQNTLMLTESREEFSDLHSIFRLRALRLRNNLNSHGRTERDCAYVGQQFVGIFFVKKRSVVFLLK